MHAPLLSVPSPDEIKLRKGIVKDPTTDELVKYSTPLEFGDDDTKMRELFFYRWKIGHQIATLLFQFAIRDISLGDSLNRNEELSETYGRVATYLAANNALVPYITSMGSSVYNNYLRPAMAMHDPSFSAHWWKEARTLRKKFATVDIAESRPAHDQWGKFWGLHAQVQIKMGIQTSLRQRSGITNEQFSQLDPVFDSFFKIYRDAESEPYLHNALNLRGAIVTADINENGLAPDIYFPGFSAEQLIELIQKSIEMAANSSKFSKPSVKSVHHIAYQTEDIESTLEWYRQMFDTTENWRMNGGFAPTTAERLPRTKSLVEIQTGSVRWHIFNRIGIESPISTPTQKPEYQHFCISVGSLEDLNAFRARWLFQHDKFIKFYQKQEKPLNLLCSEIIMEENGQGGFYCTDLNGMEIEITYIPRD